MKRKRDNDNKNDTHTQDLSSKETKVNFMSSEVKIGDGIKWTTTTLPQLQLICFDVDIQNTHLEARKLLSELI